MSVKLDTAKFLLSLASAIATRADLSFSDTPREIWVNGAIGTDAADPCCTLRNYPGASASSVGFGLHPAASIQIDVRGQDADKVNTMLDSVFLAFADDDGRPLNMLKIDGIVFSEGEIAVDADGDWMIGLVRIVTGPGLNGRDEEERWMGTFNVDVKFDRVEREPIVSL